MLKCDINQSLKLPAPAESSEFWDEHKGSHSCSFDNLGSLLVVVLSGISYWNAGNKVDVFCVKTNC